MSRSYGQTLSELCVLRTKSLPADKENSCNLVVAAGSILDFVGDVIVNAANEGCTGGFGVDEQINRAAGYKLKEARKEFNGCETGNAKVTPSFEHTKCSHIIHAVGPVYRIKFGSTFGDAPGALGPDIETYLKSKDHLLTSAYKRSMEIASELNAKTIGFTLLSCGVFRGERDLGEILEIGIRAIAQNCYVGLETVTMVAWTSEEQQVLVETLDRLFPN
eukprot:TRINITY_DN3231_c0_g1_i1.p1 TRINITY_DN3231_c0_g1~~TRINITY_DN3231_c0_g1_i1.p1  ORF type:complete len:219 (-),score=36.69 TRINITY_DN3231_c0_g1_i1:40-696(-)